MKITKIMMIACMAALASVVMAFSVSAADESETTEVAIDETNFPGEILRYYLKQEVDHDGNGAISQEEMPRAWDVGFDRIEVEDDPDEEIPVIDLTGIDLLTEMHSLSISGYNIENADFTGCEKLESLSLSCKEMDGFVLPDLSHLESLTLSTDMFTEFKLENYQSLKGFAFNNSPNLKKLEIKNVPQLNLLICSNNSLVTLDMDTCPALQIVDCQSNDLTKLDTSKMPNLQWLYCSGNMITQLDISNCQYLIRNIKEYDPQVGDSAYPIEADKITNIIGLELTTTQNSEQGSTQSTVQESSTASSESQETTNNTTILIVILGVIVVAGIAAAVIITKANDGKKDK